MKYDLVYFLMCGIDGKVNDKSTTQTVEAEDDKSAAKKANEFLEKEFSGSNKTLIIPWSPQLYEGQRLVAFSEACYPPRAHRLFWLNVPRELISA